MQKAHRLLVSAMLLAFAAATPLAALETARVPSPLVQPVAPLSTDTGFAPGGAATVGDTSHGLDAIAVVLADPLMLPVLATGGLAMLAAMLLRRRRRRRVAWGYVPATALPRRVLALPQRVRALLR